MKTKLLALLLMVGSTALVAGPRISIGIGIGGFGHGYGGYYAPAPVYYAPMPAVPVATYIPPSPGVGYTYVSGYWYPYGGRYSWRAGYWAPPAYRGAHWVAPRYYGRRYYGGYWRR